MTKLEAFTKRQAFKPAALIVAGLVALGATAFVSTPQQTHIAETAVTSDEAGTDLLRAAEVRIEDQFADMKRLVDVIESVADRPISGADKMRAVTRAARQFADITPDQGAAAHDRNLFAVANGVSSEAVNETVVGLNRDKLELGRASLALRNIQTALVAGNDEDMGNALVDLEASISRYEGRHPKPAATDVHPVMENPVTVSLGEVKQYVELHREHTRIEIERQKTAVDLNRDKILVAR